MLRRRDRQRHADRDRRRYGEHAREAILRHEDHCWSASRPLPRTRRARWRQPGPLRQRRRRRGRQVGRLPHSRAVHCAERRPDRRLRRAQGQRRRPQRIPVHTHRLPALDRRRQDMDCTGLHVAVAVD